MCPKRRYGNVHRGSDRCQLKFDSRLAKLLDGSGTHGATVAHKSGGLAVPLRVDPINRVFQYRRGAVVVFRLHEYETIGRRDLRGPVLNDVVFVRRPPRPGRRHWLVEEGHWEIAKVQKPRFYRFSLLKLLKNPLSRLFREPALACAADDD